MSGAVAGGGSAEKGLNPIQHGPEPVMALHASCWPQLQTASCQCRFRLKCSGIWALVREFPFGPAFGDSTDSAHIYQTRISSQVTCHLERQHNQYAPMDKDMVRLNGIREQYVTIQIVDHLSKSLYRHYLMKHHH